MSAHAALTDVTQAVEWLERDALGRVALLKMLAAYPGAARAEPLIAEGRVRGAMVRLPVAVSAFDRATYPAYRWIVLAGAEDPMLVATLSDRIPEPLSTVWKVFPSDAAALAARLPLRRATAYVTHGGMAVGHPDPQVLRSRSPPASWCALIAEGGMDSEEISLVLAGGGMAFAAAPTSSEGHPVCAALAWPVHGKIWEIGGLVTRAAERNRGWARRVVGTALDDLATRGWVCRYQAREDNHASLAVARRIGLPEVSRLEHWVPK